MFQGIFKSAIKMPDTNTNYIFGTGSIPINIKSAQLETFADGSTKQQGYQVAEVNKLISTMLTGWDANGNKPKSMSDNYLELILSCDNGFVVKKRLQFPHIIAWKDDSTPYNIADIYKEFSIDNWLKADDFENPDITLVVEPTDEILTTSTATPPEATTTNSGRFYLYYRNLPIGVNRVHIDFHIKTKTEPIDFDLEVIDGLSWKDAQTILASNEQAKINVLLGTVKDVYKFTGAEGNFEEITMHEWSALYQQIISLKPNNKFTHDLYFYIYDESELNTKLTELEGKVDNVFNVNQNVSDIIYTSNSARDAIPESIRRKGMVITYKVGDRTWIIEQYIGDYPKSPTWVYDLNWRTFEDKSYIDAINEAIGDIELNNSGYLLANGTVAENSNFSTSDFIMVKPSSKLAYRGFAPSTTMNLCEYDESYALINSVVGNGLREEISFTIGANTKYIRICSRVVDGEFKYAYIKTIVTDLVAETEKKTSVIEITENLFNGILSSGYVNYTNGNIETNANFSYTDLIPCKPNTKYVVNFPHIQTAFYKSDGVTYDGGTNSSPNGVFTTSSNASYFRTSVRNSDNNGRLSINEGENIMPYKGKYSLIPSSIPNKFVTKAMLSDDAIGSVSLGRLYKKEAITNGGTLKLADCYVRRNTIISAYIKLNGSFISVQVGRDKVENISGWVEIDNTNIVVKILEYNVTTTIATIAHGLQISDFVAVSIMSKHDTASIVIATNSGVFRTEEFAWHAGGAPFVYNENSQSIDCELSFFMQDCIKDVYAYGDSYYNYWQSNMWTYYMHQWGLDNAMFDSVSGGNSYMLYLALLTDISVRKPKYIVWSLGMNDGGDTNDTTPNDLWLQYINNVIRICNDNKIELILTTIPSVPSGNGVEYRNNEAKNNYVRNSGFRYIDVAKAVGANGNNEWYTGMRGEDTSTSRNVHPSALGAKAIAQRVLVDFPEITMRY